MSSYVIKKTPGDNTWFRHDRFGLFVHFGLYALPARHEWVKRIESISEAHYQTYFEHFNPDLFDAREWARQAKAAGMKYAVLTTKHHEGFCLFDSQYTDYKITNTPFGRDLVKEYVEAFREAGLKVGFYYSLIDWHHPDFPIDCMHPRRHDSNAQELDRGRDCKKYAEYMRNQVRELLTNYGKIDIAWFDYSYTGAAPRDTYPWMQFGGGKGKDQWEADKLLALCRELQPHILIDNRTGIEQDIWTPEQFQPTEWIRSGHDGELVNWEACQTFSGSWGYYRDEASWKSPKMLLNLLIDSVSCGGNLIMNVGPTGRGNFDPRAEEALRVFGNWMRLHSRAIYGCTMAEPEFSAPAGCKLTQSEDGTRLYIHLQNYPFRLLKMEHLAGKIAYAQFLNDASEILYEERNADFNFNDHVQVSEGAGTVTFHLPPVAPDVIVPVIEIFLK